MFEAVKESPWIVAVVVVVALIVYVTWCDRDFWSLPRHSPRPERQHLKLPDPIEE